MTRTITIEKTGTTQSAQGHGKNWFSLALEALEVGDSFTVDDGEMASDAYLRSRVHLIGNRCSRKFGVSRKGLIKQVRITRNE
jgi:hypothetical protein